MVINNIKISVIVPAYNVEQWIDRCLNSIIEQTYNNLEIIVIDDGSKDSTGKILDGYAERDHRFVVVHQNNKGLAKVRNIGIELATGDYIGFVDGDDEISHDMYERLIHNAIEYDAEISQCGILYCFDDGRKKPMHGTDHMYVFDREEGYRQLLLGEIMEPSLCNKLYKSSLMKDSCLDENMTNNEDLLRNSVLFSRAQKTVFHDFCGYYYWRRSESMSNNSEGTQNNINILKARRLILETAPRNLQDVALNSFIAAVITGYNIQVSNKNANRRKLAQKYRQILKNKKKAIRITTKKTRLRAYLIIYIPFLYDVFYRIHCRSRKRKIKRDVKNVKRRTNRI